jgi:hypothetical protein
MIVQRLEHSSESVAGEVRRDDGGLEWILESPPTPIVGERKDSEEVNLEAIHRPEIPDTVRNQCARLF